MGIPAKNYHKKAEGFRYESAVIQVLDWSTKTAIKTIKYVPPVEHLGEGLSVMFKGAAVYKDKIYVATNTEVVVYDLVSLRCENVISHASFHDLHAVFVKDEDIYVCNTGLEIVQKLDSRGHQREEWNLATVPTWERFDRSRDYRGVATTKPHEVHINHLFELEGEVWVTLGGAMKARPLQKESPCIDMKPRCEDATVLCHDGLVKDDYIYFTSVDGNIIIVSRDTRKVEDRIDLATLSVGGAALGWTRGLEIVGNKAYIGATKLRGSKFKEYTKWLLTRNGASMPSSILEVDLIEKCISDVYPMGVDRSCAIYSIIEVA